ncbi:hypothetical protein [Echinicola rosea]|uniref:Uncharacterized protein n=1 Tax=Echinicola rosea TaxID=1807691 RepID=A0ABQ1UNC9_9BACT|nr:hypothetical protein [Echinicola rosea]GGF23160.1 hypothetical protein GCM10011339_08990 [Echinicola rosea]
MTTKFIATGSAIFMLAMGVGFTFFPHELTMQIVPDNASHTTLLSQVMGAMYIGFAILNWTQKNSLIGGIYNRPLVLANFSHFMIGGLPLLKTVILKTTSSSLLIAATIIYVIFALLFGWLMFRHPLVKQEK